MSAPPPPADLAGPASPTPGGPAAAPTAPPAPRLTTLRSHYLLGSITTLLLMLGLLTWNALHQMDSALQAAAHSKAQALQPVLAAAVGPLLVVRDQATLQQVLQSAATAEGVVALTVHDSGGHLVGQAGVVTPPPQAHWSWHSAAVDMSGQALGQVRFALDLAPMEQARRALLRNTALIALLVGLAGLGLMWLGTSALTRGLARLAQASRQVADGQYSAPLPDSRVHELHLVADSFNRMAEAVRSQVAALRHSEQQLEQRVVARTADLQRVVAEAEQANRAKSRFLSRMSHELRTPLNAVIGFAQLLTMDKPPLRPEQLAHAGQIQQAGWHLLEMIDDMLDVSRIEAGEMQLKLQPLPLAEVVAQALAMLAAPAQARNITLHDRCAGTGLWVMADRRRLLQVLSNLVGNAVKYIPAGGTARVQAVAQPGGRVALRVADDGPGFSADEQARLFQPFTRFERGAEAVPGTGIGLLITRQLVTLMGGELGLVTGPGQGSQFQVLLPATAAVLPAAAARAAALPAAPAPAPAPTPTPTRPPRRLLYIEDNPTNACFIAAAVQAHGGYTLQGAADGETGLAAALADPPDIALVDIGLPGISGIEVCRRLRAEPRTRGLPLVAFSANAMPDDIALAMAAGFDHYLCKPVELDTLFACLDRLTDAPAPAPGSP